MEPATLPLRLIFLLSPGLVGAFLYRSMRGRRRRHNWEILLQMFLLSLASYFIYSVLFISLPTVVSPTTQPETQATQSAATTAHSTQQELNSLNGLFQVFVDEKATIPWPAVWISTAISVLLSIVGSIADTRKWFPKICRKFNISNCSGEEDIWEFFFDSENIIWVLVRDHKVKLAYYGRVRAFSDAHKKRELILLDVDVYSNDTAEKLYSTPIIYFSRETDDLTIEIPPTKSHNEQTADAKEESHGKGNHETHKPK